MKLRPQFNLRLRDAEQFIQFQNIAAAQGISMTEWLLRQAEASIDLKRGLADIAGLNRTATSVEYMREQAMANMQRGRKSANHTESAEEWVEGADIGAGKSGGGEAVREVGKKGGKESGVQGAENFKGATAFEKGAIGVENGAHG